MADRYRVAVSGGSLRSGEGVAVAHPWTDEEWHSTGIHYDVALDSRLTPHQIERLLSTVEEVAEVPRVLRAGPEVRRVGDV